MSWSGKNRWKSAALYTAVAVNFMLTALILVRHYWAPPVEVPSMARPEIPSYRSEYLEQYEGSSVHGGWKVDHYRQIEVITDEDGHVVKERPTQEMTHIRYWIGE
ncbi:hypothetical protein [Planifilum fimeticola]